MVVVLTGKGIVAIMAGSLACEGIALAALVLAVRRTFLSDQRRFRTDTAKPAVVRCVSVGCKHLSGTIFSQADRLLVAALLGPAALAYYGICVQAAQPIHGLHPPG